VTEEDRLAGIHHEMGRLAGAVEELGKRLSASETAATTSRAGVHRRLDELRDDTARRLRPVEEFCKAAEPELKRVSDFVDRAVIIEAKGQAVVKVTAWLGARALRVLRWLAALAAAALLAFWRELVALLHLGPPPHP
jgi:hypothetical protein